MIQEMDHLPSNPEGERRGIPCLLLAGVDISLSSRAQRLLCYIENHRQQYYTVEDIYDIPQGDMSAPKDGFGFLNSLGDFVNGMMRL